VALTGISASHALGVGAHLGEGPIWIDDALWFVDIKGKRIYRHDPAAQDKRHWDAPEYVGWVVPAARGGLIAGLQSGPHRFDPDTGRFERLATIDADHPANRLNDAAVDAAGNIWFGTMDNDEEAATGRLYRWDGETVADAGTEPVVITNGPAIPPEGDRLYHVDTLGKRLIRHAIGADGSIDGGETFLTFGPEDGHPDGAICDAEGGVWLGFYGGWEARRYAPDGTLTNRVRFPVANVTKIALGGADGRTAWATTARQGLDEDQLARQPLAGDLFTFRVDIPAAPVRLAK
jgi:xylono-1,5-lactonase